MHRELRKTCTAVFIPLVEQRGRGFWWGVSFGIGPCSNGPRIRSLSANHPVEKVKPKSVDSLKVFGRSCHRKFRCRWAFQGYDGIPGSSAAVWS